MSEIAMIALGVGAAIVLLSLNIWYWRVGRTHEAKAKASGVCVDCGIEPIAHSDTAYCDKCRALDQAVRF